MISAKLSPMYTFLPLRIIYLGSINLEGLFSWYVPFFCLIDWRQFFNIALKGKLLPLGKKSNNWPISGIQDFWNGLAQRNQTEGDQENVYRNWGLF
jgi:hypothetical protein